MLGLLLTMLATCPPSVNAVVVETHSHRLFLCEGGQAIAEYEVAIGSGGTSSGRVKWAQTPLGRFTLTEPRPSAHFHVFIPLTNPDPKRFSAWAIGIHGPPRETKDEGALNVASDWTWGCIALASDALIDEVATFVRSRHATRVDFR